MGCLFISGGDADTLFRHLDDALKKHASIKNDLVLEGLLSLANA